MSAAFPIYSKFICDTYTPSFIAGPTPCELPSIQTATKSRLIAGGTFFRSVKDGGADNVNQIILTCVVTQIGNVGGVITEEVDFSVTDPQGNIENIPTITQIIDTNGSPDVCIQDGFSQLRAALSVNQQVEMPVDDSAVGGAGSGWVLSDQAYCMITAFGPINMTGSLPSTPATPTGRTGPTYTLLHIADIEDGSKGEITLAVNRLSEWNGNQWVTHPSALYEPAYDASGNIIIPHPDCPTPTPIP